MKNRIGVIAFMRPEGGTLKQVAAHKLDTCQLVSWNPKHWTDEMAEQVKAEIKESGIKPTAFWAGWAGPAVWDLLSGPATLGLVPPAFRFQRIQSMLAAGDFAKKIGLPAVITHLGFIPEWPRDRDFGDLVDAVKYIARYYKRLGLQFWFETGQETPVTMLRLIQQTGMDNLGINLDPANLILYGKANPIDALDVFGQYVRNIHAKDAFYPTDPMHLGEEVKVGTGKVDFPRFVKRLGEIGFKGEFIIEREIDGDQQIKDINETVKYLRKLFVNTPAKRAKKATK